MAHVDLLEAEESLPELVRQLEDGSEEQVVLTRNGTPVARIVLMRESSEPRIGAAKGMALYRDGWDSPETAAEIAALFGAAR